MYEIAKSFEFAASHQLPHVAPEHPCHRLHGHNYVVTLHLRKHSLDYDGMVADYNDLKVFKRWIDDTLDHRHLNDIIINPTAERIAKWIYENAPNEYWHELIYKVVINETNSTEATYTPTHQ